MPFRAIHIALSIDNVLYIATARTYILIGEQCKNSTASVQPPRISRTRQSTTECNTPINRAPARAARWTNRCRGGIAASMQKPPVRATHKRANGRLPNRSIICRNKESKAYAAAVTPRLEPAAGRVRHRKPCSRCVRPAVPGAVAMSVRHQSDVNRHPIRHPHFCQPMSCGRLPAKPDGP